MAVNFKFNCSHTEDDFLEIELSKHSEFVVLIGEHDGETISFMFDKSTSIKFAKTLRTEINKIQ